MESYEKIDPKDDSDEATLKREARAMKTRELNVAGRNYVAAMYAIPLLYYAKTQRGISAYKMQKLLYPNGNTQQFVAKLLRPEQMRFDFIFKLIGVIGVPLDVGLALLFSIYRKEHPDYMKNLPAPADIANERTKRRSKAWLKKHKEITFSVSKNSRYRFLRFLVMTMDIPPSVYSDYLNCKSVSDFSEKAKSISLLTMMDIIKICAITDHKVSDIINKALGNVTNDDTQFLYITPARVEGVIPIKHFEGTERVLGKPKQYGRFEMHGATGDLRKDRDALANYMEKLLSGEGEDIFARKRYESRGRGAKEIEEDDAEGKLEE